MLMYYTNALVNVLYNILKQIMGHNYTSDLQYSAFYLISVHNVCI